MDRVSAKRKFCYISRGDAALRLVFLGQFYMVIIVRTVRPLWTTGILGIPYAERPKRFASPVEKALPMVFNATTYGYQCPDINLNATLDRQNGMVNNKFVSTCYV